MRLRPERKMTYLVFVIVLAIIVAALMLPGAALKYQDLKRMNEVVYMIGDRSGG